MTAVFCPEEAEATARCKARVGFSGAAFLADDGDGFHRGSLQNIKPAIVQACKRAYFQFCMDSRFSQAGPRSHRA